MATQQDIKQALLDTLARRLSDVLDVPTTEAYEHVGESNRSDPIEMPAYTFELFSNRVNRGITGGPLVADNAVEDDAYEILYANEHNVTCDIGAHAPRDSSLQASELLRGLEVEFTLLQTTTPSDGTLHSAVRDGSMRVDGIQSLDTTSEAIRGERFRVTFDYYSFVAITSELMQSIDLSIEDGNETEYHEQTFTV